MSTADCKNYLIKLFPDTKASGWKRVTKYKNSANQDVRVFQYNGDKMVGIVENDGVLSLVQENESLERKNANPLNYHVTQEDRNAFKDGFEKVASNGLKASDYVFSIWRGFDYDIQSEDETVIYINKLSHWKEHKAQSCTPDETPAEFFPKDWLIEDVNESGTWVFETELTNAKIKKELIKIGFTFDQEFDDYINKDEPPEKESKQKKLKTAADYVFTVWRGEEDYGMRGFKTILITPIKYWNMQNCMYDQPDYTPAKFVPKEWIIDDVNECGTWMMETDLSNEEIHSIMIKQGFIYDKKFDEFIHRDVELKEPSTEHTEYSSTNNFDYFDQSSYTNSSDFLFAIFKRDKVEGGTVILTTPVKIWEHYKCEYDQDCDILGTFFPKEWNIYNVHGNSYFFETNWSHDKIHHEMLNLGFAFNIDFQNHINK
jgi:hypothetical protein